MFENTKENRVAGNWQIGRQILEDEVEDTELSRAYRRECCLQGAQTPERISKVMPPLGNTVSLIHSNQCDTYKKEKK